MSGAPILSRLPTEAGPALREWSEQRARVFYAKTDLAVPDETLRGLRSRTHAQLGLTPERIGAVCRTVLDAEPLSVAPLEQQGTFHRLFRVRVPDHDWVFRANAASDLYRDFLLHLDPWLAERLHSEGLPTLRVRAVDTSRSVFPLDYELLEHAATPTLQTFNADEPRMQTLLGKLGALAARVHEIRLDGFGFLDVRPLLAPGPDGRWTPRGFQDTWPDYLTHNLQRHAEECVRVGAISPAEADRILALVDEHAGRLGGVEPRLLHGDLGSHNVLTDGNTIAGLIDWEDCLAGDPVFDIAFWATFQLEYRYPAFLEGYRTVRALPDDFEARFWLYYLRVSLAKTVHRHRFAYTDLPGREPAVLRLRRGLDGLARAA